MTHYGYVVEAAAAAVNAPAAKVVVSADSHADPVTPAAKAPAPNDKPVQMDVKVAPDCGNGKPSAQAGWKPVVFNVATGRHEVQS